MKRKIAVLRGGPSSEYEVSLKTGKSVISALQDFHNVTDIIVDKNGDWYVGGFLKKPHEAVRGADVVFNAMHGEYGEDGKVQQLLEVMGIPFTGPKTFSAAISIDKAKTKEIYKQHNIKTPHSKVLVKNRPIEEIAYELFRSFPMPVIIKPLSSGSSVGILIAKDYRSLVSALEISFNNSVKVLIEEYINGQEGTVGVVDGFRGQKHYAMFPVEIKPPKDKDFFDYQCKYDGSTEEICPGNFRAEDSKAMQEIAKLAHQVLGLRHYSRSDFIIHPRRGIYILETNSLPGLTKESLLPKSFEPVGTNYREFLEHVIGLALEGK